MSTNETVTSQIDDYAAAVRAALTDLPDEVRADLLEDLPDHLSEVMAEGSDTLRDRLGDPAAYAMELRVAAGYEPADATPEPAQSMQAKLIAAVRRTSASAGRMDARLGRLVGYARIGDLARALLPGWWVLRGWLVAQLVCTHRGSGGWTGFVPPLGNSRLLGGAVMLALIVLSVLIGRSTSKFSEWPRRIGYLASTAIAVWGLAILAPYMAQTHYVFEGASVSSDQPVDGVDDVYVYDQNGNPVPNARLYDQNGNPIQLGSGYCADGSDPAGIPTYAGMDPNSQAWTYPLCPSDPGPFQSGPGPVTAATPTPAPATSSAPASSGSSSAPASSAPTTAGS